MANEKEVKLTLGVEEGSPGSAQAAGERVVNEAVKGGQRATKRARQTEERDTKQHMSRMQRLLWGWTGRQYGTPYAAQRIAGTGAGMMARGVASMIPGGVGQAIGAGLSAFPAFGLAGAGLLGAAAGAVGLGIGGLMQWNDEAEHVRRLTGVSGTSQNGVRGALRGRGWMARGEAAGLTGGLARASGGLRGLGGIFDLQQSYGLGSQGIGMLGASARVGNRGQQNRELAEAIGAATAQHLEKGRMGEVFEGIQSVLDSTPLGWKASTGAISILSATLGRMGSEYQGTRGFQTMGMLNQWAQGGHTPFGQATSLGYAMQRSKGDFFKAKLMQEGGLFGGKEGAGGVDHARGLINYAMSVSRGNKMQAAYLMGPEVGGMKNALKLMEMAGRKGITKEEMEAAIKEGESDMEKTLKEIKGDSGQLEESMQKLNDELAKIGRYIVGPLATFITMAGRGLSSWMPGFKYTQEEQDALDKYRMAEELSAKRGKGKDADDIDRMYQNPAITFIVNPGLANFISITRENYVEDWNRMSDPAPSVGKRGRGRGRYAR